MQLAGRPRRRLQSEFCQIQARARSLESSEFRAAFSLRSSNNRSGCDLGDTREKEVYRDRSECTETNSVCYVAEHPCAKCAARLGHQGRETKHDMAWHGDCVWSGGSQGSRWISQASWTVLFKKLRQPRRVRTTTTGPAPDPVKESIASSSEGRLPPCAWRWVQAFWRWLS